MKKKYNTTSVFVAACAGMAFFGVTMLSLGPILGQLVQQVGDRALALPSTMSIGIIVGTIFFGYIVDRFGYKYLTIISSILALVGVQGLARFQDLTLLHIAMICLGIGGGILNGLTNALVADIYDDDKRAGKMGILGAFYCIGALVWTILNVFITDYHLPLNAISVIMTMFIIYFCYIPFPQAKPSENVGFKQTLSLFKYPFLLLFALILFFQSGFEGALGNFTVEFLKSHNGLENQVAVLSMTCFTIGMMCGRFPLGIITAKLRELKTLYLYLIVGLIGLICYVLATTPFIAYVAMTLIGFGVGATFPVILNYVGGAFRSQSGTAISIVVFIALIGQFTFNKIVGVAFETTDFIVLPIMLFISIVVIMILTPITLKISKK